MEAERHPASSETDTLHSLAKLVASYLRDGEGESLPSKQAVASSNLVSRSNLPRLHRPLGAFTPPSY